jgi:hypothetical protein
LQKAQPNDSHEQKADRAADKVMRLSHPYVQLQRAPKCKPQPKILKTRKHSTNPPRKWYGASYFHTFDAAPKGCSLRGVQVTESVSTERDDFQWFPKLVSVGQNVWTLTSKNTLGQPDSIWSPAGRNGFGSKPLLAWPAVMRQVQRWFYRYFPQDSWKAIWVHRYIYVKLHGNLRKRGTQKVTTWVTGGKPGVQQYNGPAIRVVGRRPRP